MHASPFVGHGWYVPEGAVDDPDGAGAVLEVEAGADELDAADALALTLAADVTLTAGTAEVADSATVDVAGALLAAALVAGAAAVEAAALGRAEVEAPAALVATAALVTLGAVDVSAEVAAGGVSSSLPAGEQDASHALPKATPKAAIPGVKCRSVVGFFGDVFMGIGPGYV